MGNTAEGAQALAPALSEPVAQDPWTSLHPRMPSALDLQGPRQASIHMCPVPSLYRDPGKPPSACAQCPHSTGTGQASIHVCPMPSLYRDPDKPPSTCAPCPLCRGDPNKPLSVCAHCPHSTGAPPFSIRVPSRCPTNALSGQLLGSLGPCHPGISFCLLHEMF